MGFLSSTLKRFTSAIALSGSFNLETLAANRTLTTRDGQVQVLDPGGAHRDVTLPTVSRSDDGRWFLICNSAAGAFDLVVKNPGAATVGTANQNEAGLFYVSPAGDWTLVGIFSFAAA